MKKQITIIGLGIILLSSSFLGHTFFKSPSLVGASVLFPYQGGTGTSTVPTTGQLLIGSGSVYAPGNIIANLTTFSATPQAAIFSGRASATAPFEINDTGIVPTNGTDGILQVNATTDTTAFVVTKSSGGSANSSVFQLNGDNVIDKAFQVGLSSDGIKRYSMLITGETSWGAGGASTRDVRLFRNGTNNLTIDNNAGGAANLILLGTASVSTNFEASGYASASLFQGAAFTGVGSCNGSKFLQWASGLFACGTPAGGTSSNTTSQISIRKTGSAFVHTASLSFDAGNFTLSNVASLSNLNVVWGTSTGLASHSAANTWSVLNQFTGGASFSTAEFTSYASASAYKGTAFPNADCTGSLFLQWATTGLFSCGTPAGGGSGTQIEVSVTTNPNNGTDTSSVSFDAGNFSVTAISPYVKVNTVWGTSTGLASHSAANTWSAFNNFTGNASVSSKFEVQGIASISGNFFGFGTGSISSNFTVGANPNPNLRVLTANTANPILSVASSNGNTYFQINSSGNTSLLSGQTIITPNALFTARANSMTSGTVASISGTGLTSGNGLKINVPNSFAGDALRIDNGGVFMASVSGNGNLELAGYASASALSLQPGTVSLPSLYWSDAKTTGWYQATPGTNTIDASINGVNKFSVTTNGITVAQGTTTVPGIGWGVTSTGFSKTENNNTNWMENGIIKVALNQSRASTSNAFYIQDKGAGSLATASFNIRSSQTVGAVASISALSLNGGQIFRITVPASTSSNDSDGLMLVQSTAGVNIASWSLNGRLALRSGIFSRGGSSACVGTDSPFTGCIDYAESYLSKDASLVPGTVVALDPNVSGGVIRATSPDLVLGVVSTNPAALITGSAFTSGAEAKSSPGSIPVAIGGRLPVLVDGLVKIGDRLVASSDGHAISQTQSGMTIGIALSTPQNGMVLMFVQNTWYGRVIPKLPDVGQTQGPDYFGLFKAIWHWLKSLI